MKKSLLIGFSFIAATSGCSLLLLGQRPPATISSIIQKSKPDTSRIRLFLGAAMSYVLRPGSLPSDMDSARLFVINALRLSNSIYSIEWEGKCFFVYSNIFREENNNEKGKQYAQKAIENLSRNGKKSDLANSYVELARYYDPYDENEVKEKIKLNEKAAQLFGEAGNKEEQANTTKHLGDLQLLNGDFTKALTELQEALKIFREIHYPELQGVYDLMCVVSIQSGNYTEALKYGLLALKTAESMKDSSAQLSTICNRLGQTMFYLNNPEGSAQYYQKALSIVLKNKDTGSVFVVVHNLANAYVRAGKIPAAINILKSTENNYVLPNPLSRVLIYSSFVYACTEMKQYEFANLYVKKLLDISAKHAVTDGLQGDIYNSITKYYLATKQYKEVIEYCALNETFCKKYGVVKNMVTNYRIWYRADSAMGNFDAALSHHKMLTLISDSLFNEAKVKQIAELQIQYETEKKEDSLRQKEHDISLLLQRNDLQQTTLKQANLIKNYTIAGILLTLIVLGLLYHQFRVNQKNHKLILQKNEALKDMLAEKEWWLKEVHHRVKNNLHTIICLLESQAMYLEKDALQAIEKSQHRIYAMSLIHQKLYQNEDLQVIDMHNYLEEFIGYLKDSFDADHIAFVIDVEPVQLNLQQAIPVALIINEGVTNAIKYAFGNEADAKIRISMSGTGSTVKLMIMDNGKGFEYNEALAGKGLGMQLIMGLGKELRGTVVIETNNGAALSISFKKDMLTNKIPSLQEDNIQG
ncbi:MAG TPA: histidine kinase dimerization/phosphoacceptor domain -containing protein [Chitinophagaceae bacterium]|nr:histidine kinase dimerization/phosphoacceptor domain -containing protein [Chitinophagaceae bacterium]